MDYPTSFQVLDLQPGEVAKVRVTYQCDDLDDMMREINKAAAIHASVLVQWDRETKVLTMEMS